jgi:predicted nucleic acid-binding protein
VILADTSVWVGHLRKSDPRLRQLLLDGQALMHPLVIGEIACGNLRNRASILRLLRELPMAALARDEEVLAAVEGHRLWGKGIGWIDAHLLASALLSNCALWTHDRRLRAAAAQLKMHWPAR